MKADNTPETKRQRSNEVAPGGSAGLATEGVLSVVLRADACYSTLPISEGLVLSQPLQSLTRDRSDCIRQCDELLKPNEGKYDQCLRNLMEYCDGGFDHDTHVKCISDFKENLKAWTQRSSCPLSCIVIPSGTANSSATSGKRFVCIFCASKPALSAREPELYNEEQYLAHLFSSEPCKIVALAFSRPYGLILYEPESCYCVAGLRSRQEFLGRPLHGPDTSEFTTGFPSCGTVPPGEKATRRTLRWMLHGSFSVLNLVSGCLQSLERSRSDYDTTALPLNREPFPPGWSWESPTTVMDFRLRWGKRNLAELGRGECPSENVIRMPGLPGGGWKGVVDALETFARHCHAMYMFWGDLVLCLGEDLGFSLLPSQRAELDKDKDVTYACLRCLFQDAALFVANQNRSLCSERKQALFEEWRATSGAAGCFFGCHKFAHHNFVQERTLGTTLAENICSFTPCGAVFNAFLHAGSFPWRLSSGGTIVSFEPSVFSSWIGEPLKDGICPSSCRTNLLLPGVQDVVPKSVAKCKVQVINLNAAKKTAADSICLSSSWADCTSFGSIQVLIVTDPFATVLYQGCMDRIPWAERRFPQSPSVVETVWLAVSSSSTQRENACRQRWNGQFQLITLSNHFKAFDEGLVVVGVLRVGPLLESSLPPLDGFGTKDMLSACRTGSPWDFFPVQLHRPVLRVWQLPQQQWFTVGKFVRDPEYLVWNAVVTALSSNTVDFPAQQPVVTPHQQPVVTTGQQHPFLVTDLIRRIADVLLPGKLLCFSLVSKEFRTILQAAPKVLSAFVAPWCTSKDLETFACKHPEWKIAIAGFLFSPLCRIAYSPASHPSNQEDPLQMMDLHEWEEHCGRTEPLGGYSCHVVPSVAAIHALLQAGDTFWGKVESFSLSATSLQQCNQFLEMSSGSSLGLGHRAPPKDGTLASDSQLDNRRDFLRHIVQAEMSSFRRLLESKLQKQVVQSVALSFLNHPSTPTPKEISAFDWIHNVVTLDLSWSLSQRGGQSRFRREFSEICNQAKKMQTLILAHNKLSEYETRAILHTVQASSVLNLDLSYNEYDLEWSPDKSKVLDLYRGGGRLPPWRDLLVAEREPFRVLLESFFDANVKRRLSMIGCFQRHDNATKWPRICEWLGRLEVLLKYPP